MSAISSQITSFTIVYSTVYPGTDQRKYQSSASLAVGEFPAQKASNAENVSIWWRHRGFTCHVYTTIILPTLGFWLYLMTYISIKNLFWYRPSVHIYCSCLFPAISQRTAFHLNHILFQFFFCIKQTFNMNSLRCLHNSCYWCNAFVFARLLSFSCIVITCIVLWGICAIVSTSSINLSREIPILDCDWNSWRANQS